MGWLFPDPKPKGKYVEKRVSVSSLRHGHSPDKRKSNAGLLKREGPPIDVDRSGKVIDGNDRLYWARKAGRRSIRVRMWD